MSAPLYVAGLLGASASLLLLQSALCLIVFLLWNRSSRPPQQQFVAAFCGVVVLPVAFIANAVAGHASLWLNAREGPGAALGLHQDNITDRIGGAFDGALTLSFWFALVWMVGVVIGTTRLMILHRRDLHERRTATRVQPSLESRVAVLAGVAGLSRAPAVVCASGLSAPFVSGFAPAVLVLPVLRCRAKSLTH